MKNVLAKENEILGQIQEGEFTEPQFKSID